MKLTAHGRAALTAATKQNGELRRVHDPSPGAPPYPAPASTLAALVRNGLMTRTMIRNKHGWPVDLWSLTDAGREALEPVHRVRSGNRTLRVPGGSTRFMQAGEWTERNIPEPQPVDVEDLDPSWFSDSARKHAEADDRRARARRLANGRRAA